MSRSISDRSGDGSVIVIENDEAATVAAEARCPIDPFGSQYIFLGLSVVNWIAMKYVVPLPIRSGKLRFWDESHTDPESATSTTPTQ